MVQDGVNGFLTDFWDHEALARRVAACLANREKLDRVRANARKTILNRYALHKLLPRHVALLKAAYYLNQA